MLSPGGFGRRGSGSTPVGPEVPCAKCERRIAGLSWGELCPDCLAQRQRRASRVARTSGLLAAVLVAIWTSTKIQPDGSGRIPAIIAVVVTYFLVRKIAMQVAMEYLRR